MAKGLVALALLFFLLGTAAYFFVPEFKRRVDYVPIRIRVFFVERKRKNQPVILPTPVLTATAQQMPPAQSRPAQLAQVTPTWTPLLPPSPTATAAPELTVNAGDKPAATATPTPTATSTATPTPTPTATPTATSTLTPTATPTPLHAAMQLEDFRHLWQNWNNCGPANLTQVLNYYGDESTQDDVQKFVKPNKWDMNVSPYELAAFAAERGFGMLVREGGEAGIVKRFLDLGMPVILETWCYPDEFGGGHYRTVIGYDENAQEFIASDTQFGPNYRISYAEQDQEWVAFNWLYIVVYRPDQAAVVKRIAGQDLDDQVMYRHALDMALSRVETNPDDPFSWFAVGTDYAAMGDYEAAAAAYDQARMLGVPFRMLWYQFRAFDTYLQLGRYQDVIDLATLNLNTVGNQEESHYYLGRAREALGDAQAARQSYEQALKFNPGFTPASDALASLDRAAEDEAGQ